MRRGRSEKVTAVERRGQYRQAVLDVVDDVDAHDAAEPLGAGDEQAVVRADEQSPRAVSIAIGRRRVPTPGSTTAMCAPMGRYGSAHHSISAPWRMLYFSISWVMSTISASGMMLSTTPWQIAALRIAQRPSR